jgi:diketogulonate reductase-like aldo/keto reductase
MTIDFNVNDINIPGFLYGTAWKEDRTEECVSSAIAAGFRAIDTANQRKHYHEAGVGAAVKKAIDAGTVSREDLFLQTKYTFIGGQDERLPYDENADFTTQVNQSFELSLKHLGTDYLDSLVLHGPSTGSGIVNADKEAWKAIEALQKAGKTKFIGISNVNYGQLAELYDLAEVKPTFVQNRCYARMGWDHPIREFCQTKGIIYQGFSLLTANPEVFQDQGFSALIEKYEKTPAQLVFQFSRQLGMLPLTGTTNPVHMAEDIKSFDFELTEDEMKHLEGFAVR